MLQHNRAGKTPKLLFKEKNQLKFRTVPVACLAIQQNQPHAGDTISVFAMTNIYYSKIVEKWSKSSCTLNKRGGGGGEGVGRTPASITWFYQTYQNRDIHKCLPICTGFYKTDPCFIECSWRKILYCHGMAEFPNLVITCTLLIMWSICFYPIYCANKAYMGKKLLVWHRH